MVTQSARRASDRGSTMRKLYIIGIGAGNPDYITVQAIKALKCS